MTHPSSARAGGYTLVEVACAFSVLSVLATTFVVGEQSSVRSITDSFRTTAALHLAAARLEQLRADPAPPALGESRFAVDADAAARLSHCGAYQSVRCLEPGLFEVVAEVSWMEPGNTRRQRVALTTLLARGGSQ